MLRFSNEKIKSEESVISLLGIDGKQSIPS